MNAPKKLIVRLVDRSGDGSYSAEYFRSISHAFVVKAAAKLKQLNEIMQPKNEREALMLALHALLMTAEPDGSTTLDVENGTDVFGRLLADTR